MIFIGNKKAFNFLQRSLEKGHVNHAYLFSGPEQVGKLTLAKMFAQHLIDDTALAADVDYANKDALLDLILLSPEIVEKNGVKKQRDISVEKIREAQQALSLFPYKGKYKILIIEDAHRMNTAAQNALLKTLEEPNETSKIILVTHEVDRILPTILSRSQVLNFGLVGDDELRDALVDEKIISLANGRPGLANHLKLDEEDRNFRSAALDEFVKIERGSLNEKFKLAEELSKDVVRTLEKMNIWMWEMRKKSQTGNDSERQRVYESLEKMGKSAELLKRTNANSRLILETLFMDI